MNRRQRVLGMKPHLFVMSVIFIGALAIGYSILPGANERIAMLERDGRNHDALQLLEQRYAAGDRSQRTLFQMQGIYEQFGNLPRLKETLEALAALRPRDTAINARLIDVYRQTQDEASLVKALEATIATRYSEPLCKELIGIHRLNGAWDKEQAAIQSCRTRGYRRADDLIRLAMLMDAGGERTAAMALLRIIDDLRKLKGDRERVQLFTMLLEGEQAREAQRRAVRWVRSGPRSEEFSMTLVDVLLDRHKLGNAIDLARELSVPGDGLSLVVAEIMLEQGQQVAAKSYLRGWIERATISDAELAIRFVEAAIDAEDVDNALRGARQFGLKRFPEEALVLLAEALANANRLQELQEIQVLLPADVAGRNPLLGAAIELNKGAGDAGKELLAKVETTELESWRLALWQRLMRRAGKPDTAIAAVTPPPREPEINLRRARPVAATPSPQVQRILKRRKKAKRLRFKAPVAAAETAAPGLFKSPFIAFPPK